jgi:hypothetical protein
MKKLFFITCINLMLASCQESQFAEKEILKELNDFPTDSIVTPDEVVDQTTGTSGGSTGTGDTTGTSGGSTGTGDTTGTSGGSTGTGNTTGTSGGSTGTGDTTGTSGGSTGTGDTTGTSGGSTGTGDTTGTSGGSTGTGDTTGTSGGSTGTGDTTGTSGGSTGTGDTTGTSGGSTGTGDEQQYQTVTDEFIQDQNAPKKLDILWVVDNSGSMSDNQNALAYNFEIFINQFVDKNVDFKMAITTTDPRSSLVGEIWNNSHLYLNSDKMIENRSKFIQDFKNLIKVGTRGSGTESGILASGKFVEKHGSTFLRNDAYFVVFYISDEEDQSAGSTQTYINYILSKKSNAGLVKAYSIVNMTQTYTTSGLANGYARYKSVSDQTAGTVSDINENFYGTLIKIGENIATLIDSFALSKEPSGIVKVFVNNVEMQNGWSYDATTRSIMFEQSAVPTSGAMIKVEYQTKV